MATQDGVARSGGRRQPNGGVPGLTMPQALLSSVVFTVVLVLAVVMRLHGVPMTEAFQVLGGAGGIGAALVLILSPRGRGTVAAMARAAAQSER
ncbi:hypothetical protein ACIQU4_27005 [Streptomyces sp. NPDC090741]|uniref:hypothetical protein n=1 Tax=Streptomyces sp. NPDC090741 TaxID=3365967 RepID=UPI0038271EFA